MDLKKNLALPEQFLCPKGKVLSGFGLGVVVSILVFAVLFLSHFLKAPSLLGFQTVPVNSSLTTSNGSTNFDEKGSVWGNTQMENSTEHVKNGSFVLEEDRASFSGKEGAVIEKTMASTSSIGNEEENRERQNTSMGNDVFDKADLDFNCTVDFVASPFLVRESSFNGKNGSFETLRIDLMDRTTSMYHDADIIVFNTGHWWTHEKTSRGEDYYQEGNHVYPRLKMLEAYKKALKTWAKWVDKNIDTTRTKVFFRGYSVTHFKGGQWNSGGRCHKETEPIFNKTYLGKYTSKMRAVDSVLRDMKTPVIYLNISRLTDYRKDGHPSIYRMRYKSEEEQIAAVKSQDCSHWCLPGVPDTWNELLYASLLRAKWGSWSK
ncbi:hypothetical protein TIFTF001_010800 [Ficus carica]|uniref:Trichome birefringence-like C-terminal domain-containing protein n=1 Tax=Ficus carica TaxID=3494 RepID=A0AA88D071_FICCA|nr:hypothetical protein TIFTF001_010800 [Ficus carica]